jgi:hypothetical protein
MTFLCLGILLTLLRKSGSANWETKKQETVFSYEYVKVWARKIGCYFLIPC